MARFLNQTITQPGDVRECVEKKDRRQTRKAEPPIVDQRPWDTVDQASCDSFPASDAPPWTLGYTGPPTVG